ncbi:MAG: helix-turn-helix domain-containing protein [Candidatus Thiodiazotropha endolucinida]
MGHPDRQKVYRRVSGLGAGITSKRRVRAPQRPQVRFCFDYPDPEVKAIRESMGFSQARFARTFGVSKRTVENWEQGRRCPTGAARTLLRLVEADPGYARRILNA